MPASRRTEISEALRQRILSAVHLQGVPADRRLPSARALAKELEADPRVVAAAYHALMTEGVVERRPPSRGFFVAPAPDGPPTPTVEWLVDVFVAGLARGMPAPDMPEHARRAMERVRLRAACIECNVDQQVWLCRELEEDYGITGTAVELEAVQESGTLPVPLRQADLLVTTASHEADARRVADRLGKPLVVVGLRRDLVARVERLLARGPVHFLGTDPRFATKLERQYAAASDAGHVRPWLVGHDDMRDLPADAPAWVMRTARDALGGVPEQLQVLPTLRTFDTSTQRTLLRYVVQSNLAAAAPPARVAMPSAPSGT